MQENFNPPSKIKLIIGLGNPGKEFENTYHNAGALFVNYLKKFKSSVIGHKLLVSDSYMNLSGRFVKRVLKKYKTKPGELLLIHDDSDIPLSKYKFSFGRGSAGHKGVESAINALGTENFWRLRIGIRPKAGPPRRVKAGDLVLKKISPKDLKTLGGLFGEIALNF